MTSSRLELKKMSIEGQSESYPSRFMVSKKALVIVVTVTVAVFVGAILATYFGKSCGNSSSSTCSDEQTTAKCQSFLCNKPTLAQDWLQSCPSQTTTPPSTQTSSSTSPSRINYRLPGDLVPTLYELEVRPFVGPDWTPAERAHTFEGRIAMHLKCGQPTDVLQFHAKELRLGHMHIESDDDPGVGFARASFDNVTDVVTVPLSRKCTVGASYTFTVHFAGVILDKLYGFYRSSYLNSKNERNYLATTKFQPTYARRAFPCLDEPAMKAEFLVRIVRHKSYKSVSNHPLKQTIPYEADNEWEVDVYEKTVKMSTYLVAYVVSKFDSIYGKTSQGISVEISARPEAIINGDGAFALKDTISILDFFIDYFAVNYPLPKITQIAIPDFNSGAMENWGLVTYRESSLLYNSKTDTVANMRRVSNVISHELAHQWFGNLVTMKWWGDLWLNEGFASWVQFLGLDKAHREWRDLEYFFIVRSLPVMVKDAYVTSHPISADVYNPADIPSIFDSISYDKGASVIRMMNAFLTEAAFKQGVTNYLNKYNFSNAEQDNLWAELTASAHAKQTLDLALTVKTVMDTWTLQKGYPVVQAARLSRTQLLLTQTWFLFNEEELAKTNASVLNAARWFVPFTYTTKSKRDFAFDKRPQWFRPDQTNLTIDLDAATTDDEWILGNVKHAGFYRVNYDVANWNKLIAQLSADRSLIDSTSRGQLLDDAFNLGRTRHLDQSVFLRLVGYLSGETDPLPFAAALSGLNYIGERLQSNDAEAYANFKTFYLNIMTSTYQRLGWKEDITDVNELDLQLSALQVMCKYGQQDCVAKSRSFMTDFFNNNKEVPNNFKSIVYQTYTKFATDREDWHRLYTKALDTTNSAEKLRMLRALTHTPHVDLLKFMLELTRNTSVIRGQDETTVIADIASSGGVAGRNLTYHYLSDNWNAFLAKYGEISFTLPSLVTNVFGKMDSRAELQMLKDFKVKHPNFAVAENVYKEVLEVVAFNVKWTETKAADVAAFLRASKPTRA